MAGRKVSFREHAVEEFIPSAAWSEDSLSHFLLVDLPDFNKEDLKLKVDYETQHITVSGQRRMNNSKYKHFQKTFKAPENSEISKTTGKFEGEILYLIIPKKEQLKKEEHIIKDDIRKDKDNYEQEKLSCEEIGSSSQNNEQDKEEKHSGHEIGSSGCENNEEDKEKKPEDDKNKEKRKKGSCVDEFEKDVIEKWGKECSVIEKTMKMVSTNKEILAIALVAFSIGIFVSRKLR